MSDTSAADVDMTEITASVVAAYAGNNHLNPAELRQLIVNVYSALIGLRNPAVVPATPAAEPRRPAVSVKKSVTPDFLICLEDGRKFKSLRRHLAQLGLTPDQYREKWGLPASYPMVAPNYSATRSALARELGLGRNREAAAPVR